MALQGLEQPQRPGRSRQDFARFSSQYKEVLIAFRPQTREHHYLTGHSGTQQSGQSRAPPVVRSPALSLPRPCHPMARPSHLTGSRARASFWHPPGLPSPGGAGHALCPHHLRCLGSASVRAAKEGAVRGGMGTAEPSLVEAEDSVCSLNLTNL